VVVIRDTNLVKYNGAFQGISPTGKVLSLPSTDFYRIADGRIMELWFEADYLGFMQWLGVFPTTGQAGRCDSRVTGASRGGSKPAPSDAHHQLIVSAALARKAPGWPPSVGTTASKRGPALLVIAATEWPPKVAFRAAHAPVGCQASTRWQGSGDGGPWRRIRGSHEARRGASDPRFLSHGQRLPETGPPG
jgi:hypothetical protein